MNNKIETSEQDLKILLVEDEVDTLEIMAQYLHRKKIKVSLGGVLI